MLAVENWSPGPHPCPLGVVVGKKVSITIRKKFLSAEPLYTVFPEADANDINKIVPVDVVSVTDSRSCAVPEDGHVVAVVVALADNDAYKVCRIVPLLHAPKFDWVMNPLIRYSNSFHAIEA